MTGAAETGIQRGYLALGSPDMGHGLGAELFAFRDPQIQNSLGRGITLWAVRRKSIALGEQGGHLLVIESPSVLRGGLDSRRVVDRLSHRCTPNAYLQCMNRTGDNCRWNGAERPLEVRLCIERPRSSNTTGSALT